LWVSKVARWRILQRAGVHVVDGALFQGGAAGSVDEGHQRGIGQQAAKLVLWRC
jgi:hypothetical protein